MIILCGLINRDVSGCGGIPCQPSLWVCFAAKHFRHPCSPATGARASCAHGSGGGEANVSAASKDMSRQVGIAAGSRSFEVVAGWRVWERLQWWSFVLTPLHEPWACLEPALPGAEPASLFLRARLSPRDCAANRIKTLVVFKVAFIQINPAEPLPSYPFLRVLLPTSSVSVDESEYPSAFNLPSTATFSTPSSQLHHERMPNLPWQRNDQMR